MRKVAFGLLLLASLPLRAQEPGFELGVRYWLSGGYHQFSHDARRVDPSAGNPTSILTYSDLEGHALELFARAEIDRRWFLRGNVGHGVIRDGEFDDEDYLAGSFKFLDSTSSVDGDSLGYFTLEVGREVWRSASRAIRLDAFAGFQQWTERVDAYGARYTVDVFDLVDDVPPGVLAISNKARWRSLRAGVAANIGMTSATRLRVELALVPYSELRNEDSHHLRDDLGPTPNVITTGTGSGVQLEAELRHALSKRVEVGVGVRHWHLRSTDADVTLAGVTLPVNEVETRRTGVTVSLSSRW